MHSPPDSTETPRGSWCYALQGAASLVWIPQAWLIATAVAALVHFDVTGRHDADALVALLVQLALGVALLGLLRAGLEYWGTRATYGWARQVLSQLRAALGQRLRETSPLDVRRPSSGLITSAWMEQAEAVVPWLARYQAAQWRVLIVTPVIAVCVAWQSWLAALLLLIAAPLIPLFMAIIGWRAQAISEEQIQALGSMHGQLLERLRGLPTLRALHAVEATAGRLTEIGEDVARRTMRVLRVAMLSSAVLELFSALGVALVAVYIGFHLLGDLPFGAWGDTLTLHGGLFVLMLAPSFFEPLRDLSAVWHDRANGRAAMQSLGSLLDDLSTIVQPATAATAAAAPCAGASPAPPVLLQNVRAALGSAPAPDGQAQQATRTQPMNLQIPAGAHVAITGPSGSGKSVLLALIAGLVRAESGRIQIGDVAMNDENAGTLRQRMGWMGQNPVFFCGSIRHNLHMGRPGRSDEGDAQALQSVGLQDVARRLDRAPLGEGGSGISGGEALRLALARLAVVPGTSLLLLDEPTAHLDSSVSALVLDTMNRLAHGKTLLVATHDPDVIGALPYTLALDGHGGARWLRRPDGCEETL